MKNQIPLFEHRPPIEFDIPEINIHIRLFRHGDEGSLVKLVDDECVQRFVPWAKQIIDTASARRTIDRFEEAWNRGAAARYVIEQDGVFAGYTGLWSDKKRGYYEFGFAVLPEFRGQGIGTRTTRKIFDTVREQPYAKGIVAYVNDENLASQAIVNIHGFQKLSEFDEGDRRYELTF